MLEKIGSCKINKDHVKVDGFQSAGYCRKRTMTFEFFQLKLTMKKLLARRRLRNKKNTKEKSLKKMQMCWQTRSYSLKTLITLQINLWQKLNKCNYDFKIIWTTYRVGRQEKLKIWLTLNVKPTGNNTNKTNLQNQKSLKSE